MRKLLIAVSDDVLRGALTQQLRRSYDITLCADGGTACDLIRDIHPDAVLLELVMPVKDGLCILEECREVLPAAVIIICDFCNPYIAQTITDLCSGYIVRKPCFPRAISARLEHMLSCVPASPLVDWQCRTAEILLQFGFNPKNDGFRFLKVGIPLYAQDPQQRICKELYVTIAQICGAGSWNQVERSIRSAIEGAWRTNADAWKSYFRDAAAPPTGKSFISRIAQELMDS